MSDYVDLYKNKDEDYDYSVPVGAVTNNGTTKVIITISQVVTTGVFFLTEYISSQPNH